MVPAWLEVAEVGVDNNKCIANIFLEEEWFLESALELKTLRGSCQNFEVKLFHVFGILFKHTRVNIDLDSQPVLETPVKIGPPFESDLVLKVP